MSDETANGRKIRREWHGPPRRRTAAAVPRIRRGDPLRNRHRDGDEPCRALAAQDHPGQRDRRARATRLAAPRCELDAGRKRHPDRGGGRDRGRGHRGCGRGRLGRRQLLHGERRAVGGQRSSRARLRPPRAPLARLLRHPPDRDAAEHHHARHRHHPGLRFVHHAQHPRRPADHRRDAGLDVLAQLGLRARRRWSGAVPAFLRGVVQQGLESVRVVNVFGRQELEEKHLVEASRAAVQAALKARRVKALLSPIVTVIVSLCTAFVLWRGASLVLASAMTAGSLTVFLSYLGKFFKPVQDLAKMSGTIAQAAVGVERVRAILDMDMSIPERPDARDPGRLEGWVEFDHVAFAYDPAVPVLRDVTFSIAAGEFVGMVGTTGAGKSTVLSLIPRLYDPTGGSILIDGVDVREYRLQGLRAQIGFVLQDTVLFRGTVRENIAYGRPAASDAEIVEAAKLANAHEFIARMPDGYDTQLGERGLTLSGGQRQRIGIARALIRDAPILILDEPTAALDSQSEKLVIEALERLMKGRTVVTVAHRLSTIRDVDKIIVFKDGVVAEQGTHDELLALGGVYAELHRIQIDPGAAPPAAKTSTA